MPARPENQPQKHTIPNYGAKVQLTEPKDTSNPLGPHDIKRLQEIIESLLLYGRGVDKTLMLTLNELAPAQAQRTEATKPALLKLLDYCATHDDVKIRYFASEMVLHVHSDASYFFCNLFKKISTSSLWVYLIPKSPTTSTNVIGLVVCFHKPGVWFVGVNTPNR